MRSEHLAATKFYRRGRRARSAAALCIFALCAAGLCFFAQAPILHAQPAEAAARGEAPVPVQVQEQLLRGVRAFRAEQYEAALGIFRGLEGTAARPELGFYLGTVLHKLGRHAEALVAFRAAQRAGLREPVADYYRAVSCFRLEMYERARAEFRALLSPPREGAGPPLGPRLLQGAERFLAAVDRSTRALPDGGTTAAEPLPAARLTAVLQKADALAERSGAEAQEWLEEAALLLGLVPARDRAAALQSFHTTLLRAMQPAQGPADPVRTTELDALWQSVRSSPR